MATQRFSHRVDRLGRRTSEKLHRLSICQCLTHPGVTRLQILRGKVNMDQTWLWIRTVSLSQQTRSRRYIQLARARIEHLSLTSVSLCDSVWTVATFGVAFLAPLIIRIAIFRVKLVFLNKWSMCSTIVKHSSNEQCLTEPENGRELLLSQDHDWCIKWTARADWKVKRAQWSTLMH